MRKSLKLRYKRLLYSSFLVVVGNGSCTVIGRLDRVAASDWLLSGTAGICKSQTWMNGSGFR